MTLTAKTTFTLDATLTDALDLSTASDPLDYTQRYRWTSGTGDDQADMLWHDQRTVAASSNEDLDLAGVLVNGLGDTQTFVTVKLLMIKAAAANTNNVEVSEEATNGVPGLFLAAGDGVSVKPGGMFVWVAPDDGVTVTASTGDLINVANSSSGTGVTYDVVIIGTSA